MSVITVTSMSQARFSELRQGIVDGSLAEYWNSLNDADLTKSQKVEKRQILALVDVFFSDPDALSLLCKTNWRQLFIKQRDDGSQFVEVVLRAGK